jgi:hypothetical protein
MESLHNIKWFLEDPNRLKKMKPFTRGGSANLHAFEQSLVNPSMLVDTGLTGLTLKPISQDRYITEYRPDLHSIIFNEAIPHIKVRLNGCDMPMGMMDMTQTASFQKLIHSAHVRSLSINPVEFTLSASNTDDAAQSTLARIKNEWECRGLEYIKSQAINSCKQLGNVGVLFSFNKETNRYEVKVYNYEDGYQIVPNLDEYGNEVARSLWYTVDGKTVIDTYTDKVHYRIVEEDVVGDESNGWKISEEIHGFSRCPLLHKRGKVAWEYAESTIEMWELMSNINNIALKRFGTFALVLIGDMDKDSFKKDSSTLVINLSADTSNGKQDAKVLDFPEPKTMDGYLKSLKEQISLFSSTSFITPNDIRNTGSGGNGIALAMSNDYAIASEDAVNWRPFVNEMLFLHKEGLELEKRYDNKFSKLEVSAKIIPWSIETNNTKITNLAMEAPYLSMKTIVEKCPDAAPDEVQRIIDERGSLVKDDKAVLEQADKAQNLAINHSNDIVDND